MKVRLTKKLADCIDGVILSGRRVGEVIDLPVNEAQLLVAESWAVAVEPPSQPAESHTGNATEKMFGDEPLTIRVPLGRNEEPA